MKDRHQVRVASGQKIPEIGVNMEDNEDAASTDGHTDEKGKSLLSPTSENGTPVATDAGDGGNEADVADRAAAMLEGLQGGGINKDGSLSVRRRRESADTERQRRRNRRQQQSSAKSEDSGVTSPTAAPIPEEGDGAHDESSSAALLNEADFEGREEEPDRKNGGTTPVTVVHPPSPELKARELPTPPPE